MAEKNNVESTEDCVIELECTNDSHPFEPRTVTVVAGQEQIIGRLHNKKPNEDQKESFLMFDNRVLSQSHATIFVQDGKLYLKDLCSLNGTYLNGEYIGPKREDMNEPKARELKTGDVLRFGKVRATQKQGNIIKPIEAKLTIKHAPSAVEPNEQVTNITNCPSNYTPYEGLQLDTTMIMDEQPIKELFSSPIKKVKNRKASNIVERGTDMEKLNCFCTTATQILPGELENKKCDRCESLAEKFYNYRKRVLIIIAVCLLIIIFYQHF